MAKEKLSKGAFLNDEDYNSYLVAEEFDEPDHYDPHDFLPDETPFEYLLRLKNEG